MSRRLLLSLVSLFSFVQLWAGPVTVDEAKEKAGKFLNKRAPNQARAKSPTANSLSLAEAGKDGSYYIFNAGNDGGYVVVSGDDATEEILGYSDTGSISSDNMPCGMRALFDGYAEQIKFLRKKGITTAAPRKTRTAYHVAESRLARYGQGDPYNDLCPKYWSFDFPNPKSPCPTGCAATAMAQLMYAYQWPMTTTNTITAYKSESNGYDIDEIEAGSTIDWSLIAQHYNDGGNYSKAQKNEIARLMLMTGAATRMDYDSDGSTASGVSIAYALKQYFGYSTDVKFVQSAYTNSVSWTETICKELQKGYPVLYRGEKEKQDDGSNGESHFFMLEGYDENGYFDVNFGHEGETSDTKENLGSFLLFVNEELDGPLLEYHVGQAAILDVTPRKDGATPATPAYLWPKPPTATGHNVYQRSAESRMFENVKLTWSCLNYITRDNLVFDYGIEVTKNGVRQGDIIPVGSSTAFPYSLNDYTIDMTFTCGADWTDGYYQLHFVSKESGTSEWIHSDNFNGVYAQAWVYGNMMTIRSTGKDNSSLSANNIRVTCEGLLRTGKVADTSFEVTNNGEDYDGALMVMLSWQDSEGTTWNRALGIFETNLAKGNTMAAAITWVPENAGRQRLVVYNKYWNEIGAMDVDILPAYASLDMLEFAGLTIKDGDLGRGLIDGTYLRGSISFHNSDIVTKKDLIDICLTDVEGEKTRTSPIAVNIEPDKTVSYDFSFANLTPDHHYIISAKYQSTEEFYHSEELLCTTDGMGEVEAGNENIANYEYWFDDNFDDRKSVDWNGSDAMVRASINTNGLPPGQHRFNFRLKRADNAYSAVNTTSFMKFDQGSSDALEYWFDDDADNPPTIPLPSIGENCDLTLDLTDAEKFPTGFHKLNLRVTTAGGGISSVYSNNVFKVPTGKANYLEYWFDDNIKDVSRIEGVLTDGSYDYVRKLNLGAVTPGAHRLYARAVSSDRKLVSATTMASIMVKSRYADIGNSEAANVAAYRIAVDGQEVEERSFPDPRKELEVTHMLDTRNLTAGKHTLTAMFWNTAEALATVEQKFNVTAREEPALTLTAEEKDGLVNLQFQPVPNDIRYRIIRTDANGAKAMVTSREGSSYPDMVSFTDNPVAGSYTYYVQTVYTDYDGTEHPLKSNEVAVNVAESQTEDTAAKDYGYIVGTIVCDKNEPMITTRVKFSDGYIAYAPLGGHFSRTRIAVGTTLTMTVEGDNIHTYTDKTITMKAGANYVVINGTMRPEYQANNLENDLGINSAVELTMEGEEHYATFQVKNLSHTNDWQGIVRVKVISKEKADGMSVGIADMGYKTKNLYVGETTIDKIGFNDTHTVKVCIKDLKPKKDADYYLYFESEGKWSGTQAPVSKKSIGANSACDMAENPVVRTIGKAGGENPQWDDDAHRDYTAFIVGVSSLVPGVDGNAGDLSPFYSKALELAKKISGIKNDDSAIQVFFEWMAGKSVAEVLNEPSVMSVTSAFYDIYANIRSYGNGTMVQKYWNDVLGASYDYASAQLIISNLAILAHATISKDPIEATVASASVIYSLVYPATSSGAVPYAAMMYSYTVIGRALVAKIMEYKKILYNAYLADRLQANKAYTGSDEGRQNTAIDIKLVVKTGKKAKTAIDFTKPDAQRQVGDIRLWAHNNSAYGPSSFHFTPVYMKDGIMLRCNGSKGADLLNKSVNLDKLSLEVNWGNGRQTFIPLNEACDGISIDMGNAANADDSFENYKPATYTITLTTTTGKDRMAEEFYLGNNKNRE